MNKCARDIKRQKILEFVYRFWDHKLEECSPNIVLNHECGIDDAVDLIYDCGELLNIPDQELDNFPFDTYFNSESVILSGGINWKNIFLFPFLIPIAFFSLIFLILCCVFKVVFYLFFRVKIKAPSTFSDNRKPPLTASCFADIMMDLCSNTQQDTKDVFGY